MSSEEFISILENTEELDRLRKVQEDVLAEINTLHEKLKTCRPEVVENLDDNLLLRLRDLYVQAKDLSEIEVRVSDIVLAELDTLIPPSAPGNPNRRLGV